MLTRCTQTRWRWISSPWGASGAAAGEGGKANASNSFLPAARADFPTNFAGFRVESGAAAGSPVTRRRAPGGVVGGEADIRDAMMSSMAVSVRRWFVGVRARETSGSECDAARSAAAASGDEGDLTAADARRDGGDGGLGSEEVCVEKAVTCGGKAIGEAAASRTDGRSSRWITAPSEKGVADASALIGLVAASGKARNRSQGQSSQMVGSCSGYFLYFH